MSAVNHLEDDCYYVNLQVARSAGGKEIKKAYRKLALVWHPDKNRHHPHAERYFKVISEAYQVLSDEKTRQHYDQYGKIQTSQEDRSSSFDDSFFHFQRPEDLFRAFFGNSDPFGDDFFTSRRRRRRNHDPFSNFFDESFGFFNSSSSFDSMFDTEMNNMRCSSSTRTTTTRCRNGETITKKTITKSLPNGEMETITQEFVNGKCISNTNTTTAAALGYDH